MSTVFQYSGGQPPAPVLHSFVRIKAVLSFVKGSFHHLGFNKLATYFNKNICT